MVMSNVFTTILRGQLHRWVSEREIEWKREWESVRERERECVCVWVCVCVSTWLIMAFIAIFAKRVSSPRFSLHLRHRSVCSARGWVAPSLLLWCVYVYVSKRKLYEPTCSITFHLCFWNFARCHKWVSQRSHRGPTNTNRARSSSFGFHGLNIMSLGRAQLRTSVHSGAAYEWIRHGKWIENWILEYIFFCLCNFWYLVYLRLV